MGAHWSGSDIADASLPRHPTASAGPTAADTLPLETEVETVAPPRSGSAWAFAGSDARESKSVAKDFAASRSGL